MPGQLIRPGQMIKIRGDNFGDLALATLLAVNDKDQLIFKLADVPDKWLKPGQRYRIETAQRDDATYLSAALLLKLEKRGRICVLQDVDKFERAQQRGFARLSVSINVEYAILPAKEFHKGTVMDISGSGLLFAVPEPLPVGSTLLFKFNIEHKDKILPLEIKGETVRELPPAKGVLKTKYRYGIKFEEIPISQQDKIVNYIFRQMAKRRR